MANRVEMQVSDRIGRAIKEKSAPGYVVGWIKNGGQKVLPFGNFTYDQNAPLVREDSIYDIASITKVFTSGILLKLIGKNQLSLGDNLVKFIPEFGNYPEKKSVTIKNLLEYKLNLAIPSMASLKNERAEQIIKTITEAQLREAPGTKYLYTNSTTMLMGLVAEKISGKKLNILMEEYFFTPLKMSRTTFGPLEKFSKGEIVPTEMDDWRGGLVHGQVHDESAYTLQKTGVCLGAAGLFSTVPDLLKFAEMTLNADKYSGLGWEHNESIRMGKYAPEIIGKSGFTGCMIMLNKTKNTSLVILSNSIYPKRPVDAKSRNSVRRDVADIVFGAPF